MKNPLNILMALLVFLNPEWHIENTMRGAIARKSGRSLKQLITMEGERGQVGLGIVETILGFIVVFYVLAYTWSPLEDAGTELENAFGNSSITGIQNISDLPDVALLLFGLLTVLGLIMAVVRSERL